jgi:hypothetical protein
VTAVEEQQHRPVAGRNVGVHRGAHLCDGASQLLQGRRARARGQVRKAELRVDVEVGQDLGVRAQPAGEFEERSRVVVGVAKRAGVVPSARGSGVVADRDGIKARLGAPSR